MAFDLILRNGRVMDPESGLDAVADVAVEEGRIAAVGDLSGHQASQEIDVRGCLVTPGLIDIHTHVWPLSHFGIHADACTFPYGVTALGAGGGTGAPTYEALRLSLPLIRTRVRVFLHVAPTGLATLDEDIDPAKFPEAKICELFRAYPDELVGLKIRMGKESSRGMGTRPLEAACALGRKIGRNVMVHCTGPEVPMDDILRILQTGDIATHIYHGHGHTLLENGFDEALRAQARGVIMDSADADGWHLSFEVLRRGLDAGLAPDVISTDVTGDSIYSPHGTFTLLMSMARMEAIGMRRMDVLRATTISAARMLRLDGEVGSLKPGKAADIAVLREVPAQKQQRDSCGNELTLRRILTAEMTILAGKVVYRSLSL